MSMFIKLTGKVTEKLPLARNKYVNSFILSYYSELRVLAIENSLPVRPVRNNDLSCYL